MRDTRTNRKMKVEIPEQLIDGIKAGVEANQSVSGSIAVGGAVCSLFAHHRASADIDFVLSDLNQRFDEIREQLFELPEWKEARITVPVLILGSLHGIEVGFRQLRRTVPLDTQIVETPSGKLVVPTVEELLRIKAFLIYNRNTTRDFVDFAELSCIFEIDTAVEILVDLDDRFGWEKQPSIIVGITKKLLSPAPFDLEDPKAGFEQLRFMEPRLKSWEAVIDRCRSIGEPLALKLFV